MDRTSEVPRSTVHALVAPFQRCKTTLLESDTLARTGAFPSGPGSVDAGTRVGDVPPPRVSPSQDGRRPHRRRDKLHGTVTPLSFVPGSVEFAHEARRDPRRRCRGGCMRSRERSCRSFSLSCAHSNLGIPRFLFLNKSDRANHRTSREHRDIAAGASRFPLVLLQISVCNVIDRVFVDLGAVTPPSSIARTQGFRIRNPRRRRSSTREKEDPLSILEKPPITTTR